MFILLPAGFAVYALVVSAPRSQNPTAEEVADTYHDLRLMTPEPVFVDPGLAALCAGPTPAQQREARDRSGPHAMAEINIYMNALAAEAFGRSEGRYPVGSIIVKEKSDGDAGGMIKRAAGYDPKHGDWEYFFKDYGGVEAGRIASCVQCHSGAATSDYVFGHWKDAKKRHRK